MSNNNLYTLSYFRQRLHNAGISSKILTNKFDEADKRYWMISIFEKEKVICTCFKTDDDFYFEFSDGKNKLKQNYILRTLSMNVVIKFIFELLDNETITNESEI
jgi:hypothetical protein